MTDKKIKRGYIPPEYQRKACNDCDESEDRIAKSSNNAYLYCKGLNGPCFKKIKFCDKCKDIMKELEKIWNKSEAGN